MRQLSAALPPFAVSRSCFGCSLSHLRTAAACLSRCIRHRRRSKAKPLRGSRGRCRAVHRVGAERAKNSAPSAQPTPISYRPPQARVISPSVVLLKSRTQSDSSLLRGSRGRSRAVRRFHRGGSRGRTAPHGERKKAPERALFCQNIFLPVSVNSTAAELSPKGSPGTEFSRRTRILLMPGTRRRRPNPRDLSSHCQTNSLHFIPDQRK